LTALQQGDANPEEASRAFISGLSHLFSKQSDEAIDQFRAARNADTANPKYAYFLALAQRQAGQTVQADGSLAEAIQLELVTPVSQWGRLMQRVQGNDRLWVEKARDNAGL
jgi:Flp pilus assembly protein TadD